MQTASSIYSLRLPSKTAFSEVYHYLPKNDREKEAGELFGVFEFLDNPGAEDALLNHITQTLRDAYYGSSRRDAFERFEEALREVNAIIAREASKRETGSLGRVSACVAVLQGKVIHFAVTGSAAVYIQRSGKFSLISSPAEGEIVSSEDTFLDIASGELLTEDLVLLSTSNILEFAGKQDVKDVLADHQTMERNARELKSLLRDAGMESFSLIIVSMGEVTAQQVMDAREVRHVEKPKGADIGSVFKKHAAKAWGLSKGIISTVGKKAVSTFTRVKPKVAIPQKNPYVFYGIIGAIGLLTIFFVVRFFMNLESAKEEQYNKIFRDIETNLQIAEQRNQIGETEDARKFLDSAETQLKEIMEQPYYRQKATALLDTINEYRDQFDGITRVSAPYVVANLAAVAPGIQPIGLINTKDDKKYVFEYNKLYETILDKVQEGLQIDEEDPVLSGWEFEDTNALVFIGKSGQVIEYKDGAFTRMSTDDPKWHQGVEVKTFSRFVYILDPVEGNIWKYPKVRSKYSTSVAYNTQTPIKDAVSFAIDGDVYVLMKDGTIKKFRKGEEQKFTVERLPSLALSNPTKIYTHPDIANLYVLDPQNNRVVVITKDRNGIATYSQQYIFTNITDLRDLYVDNVEKKLYVLTKDSIYGTDL